MWSFEIFRPVSPLNNPNPCFFVFMDIRQTPRSASLVQTILHFSTLLAFNFFSCKYMNGKKHFWLSVKQNPSKATCNQDSHLLPVMLLLLNVIFLILVESKDPANLALYII